MSAQKRRRHLNNVLYTPTNASSPSKTPQRTPRSKIAKLWDSKQKLIDKLRNTPEGVCVFAIRPSRQCAFSIFLFFFLLFLLMCFFPLFFCFLYTDHRPMEVYCVCCLRDVQKARRHAHPPTPFLGTYYSRCKLVSKSVLLSLSDGVRCFFF